MLIDVLQHVPFEGLAAIEDWGQDRGHHFRIHHLYEEAVLPAAIDVTMLIILGGPMSANDTEHWLEAERDLIRELISKQQPIFGICLGAQQIAKAIGADIFQGEYKEVGWHPIQTFTQHFSSFLPDQMTAFHWHGEQFSLPDGAIRLFGNTACENQGFIYKDFVIGLQFHLEMTEESIIKLITHDQNNIDHGKYVQSGKTMLSAHIPTINKKVLYQLLDSLVQQQERK
ncbi:GMP synthase - Glutamine amidotransferase [Terribacillus aidingensis]|uniref:GMP synthase - Glutamine amidotransferase n=1 Tax=Terribacillus aidingensis TaxID=586416 RepID=A0A285P470_9BACI|nr:type 1 glutamine amidotransferase [Terribacillus aidingensis]SNZ16067.1 GMP synthase - Glutamine amidotransferase [Terribacillus aidingensis]